MSKICPHCGKESNEEFPRFCSGCGARMDGGTPIWYPGYTGPMRKHKSQAIAGLCSSFLPGLGQIYNGETAKGFVVFLIFLIGLVFFVIPGLFVWFYAMYNAYSVAGMMNRGEIPFREMRMLHMVLFVVFAIVVVIIALAILFEVAISLLSSYVGPMGSSDMNQLFNTNGFF